MEPFTIKLGSNAPAQSFPDITLSSFTHFLPEQLNLEGQWKVTVSEISYSTVYQNVTEEKFRFFSTETLKIVRILLSGSGSLPFHYGFCYIHDHSNSRRTQLQQKLYHS